MKAFKFIEKMIVGLNMGIVVISLLTMIILGFIQIILRNCFDSGLIWADIIIRNLVLWLGFAGAVVATSKGRHIAIGALVRFVPDGIARVVHIIVSIASAVICFFLTYASIQFVKFEIEAESILYGNIPLWISELIIPATFCFLTYQFFIHAFEKPQPNEEVAI